jgi:tetratricopeptide (TPR) repeat protein
MKNILATCLCLTLFLSVQAQENSNKYANLRKKIDSLYNVLSVAMFKKDTTGMIDIHNSLANFFVKIDENSASTNAFRALQLAEKIQYQKGQADALVFIGLLDQKQIAKLDNAIKNAEKALNIYKELDLKDQQMVLHEVVGTFYFKKTTENREDYQKALQHFQDALNIRESGKVKTDSTKLAQLYDLLGEVNSYLNQDDEAIKAFEKAEKIKEALGTKRESNHRLLMKYRRTRELQAQIENNNTTQIVVSFSILVVVLSILLIYNIIKKNDALKKLKLRNQFQKNQDEDEDNDTLNSGVEPEFVFPRTKNP